MRSAVVAYVGLPPTHMRPRTHAHALHSLVYRRSLAKRPLHLCALTCRICMTTHTKTLHRTTRTVHAHKKPKGAVYTTRHTREEVRSPDHDFHGMAAPKRAVDRAQSHASCRTLCEAIPAVPPTKGRKARATGSRPTAVLRLPSPLLPPHGRHRHRRRHCCQCYPDAPLPPRRPIQPLRRRHQQQCRRHQQRRWHQRRRWHLRHRRRRRRRPPCRRHSAVPGRRV